MQPTFSRKEEKREQEPERRKARVSSSISGAPISVRLRLLVSGPAMASLYDILNSVKEESALELGLKELREGIRAMRSVNDDFENQNTARALSDAVEQLCRLHYVDARQNLYNLYKEELEQYNSMILLSLNEKQFRELKEDLERYNSMILLTLQEKHDEELLRELIFRWDNYLWIVSLMSSCFDHLTSIFIKPRSLLTLDELALEFREKVSVKIHAALVDFVEDHEVAQIEQSLVKHVVRVFDSIWVGVRNKLERDMYEHFIAYCCGKALVGIGVGDDLKTDVLRYIIAYYSGQSPNQVLKDSGKASLLALKDSSRDVRLKSNDLLGKVRDIVSTYLPPTVAKKLQLELAIHQMRSECSSFSRDGKVEDLSRIWELYDKVPEGLELSAVAFQKHVFDRAEALVQHAHQGTTSIRQAGDVAESSEDDAAWKQDLVIELIKLHDEYKSHIVNYFNHNRIYMALQDAFRELFSTWEFFAVSLAKYCDNMLRKGKLTDDKAMDTVIELIDCLSDKDLFSEFYRQQLGSRLFVQSTSRDHESTFIEKMQQACGNDFTNKMEVMLKDIKVQLCTTGDGNLETVSIISRCHWPKFEEVLIKLPEEMENTLTDFKERYLTENPLKKLSWVHSLSTCTLNAKFDDKEIELVVSVPQAALLLAFNDANRLSVSEIKSRLGITDDVLSQLVQSLSTSEYKILAMERTGEPHVLFNHKFRTQERSLQVPVLQLIDEKKVTQKVNMFRLEAIDAALVRIAKTRKVISTKDLIKECVEQVPFKVDVAEIESRIACLHNYIDHELLEGACRYIP